MNKKPRKHSKDALIVELRQRVEALEQRVALLEGCSLPFVPAAPAFPPPVWIPPCLPFVPAPYVPPNFPTIICQVP